MGYEVIGVKAPEHKCDFPKWKWYERTGKYAGLTIKCDCGRVWEYKWHGYAEMYAWSCVNARDFLPKPPSGPAAGAR